MSLPREGSRDTGEGIVVSTQPDVCLTPQGAVMVPVPYTIWAKQEDDAATTPTVRMTSLRTHNMGSLITTCHGDEAGTGGGVKSGTHNGICEPKEHSARVRAEGKFSIRHDDVWWMNNRNTEGKLLWIKDPRPVELALQGNAEEWIKFLKQAPAAETPAGSRLPVPGSRLPAPEGRLPVPGSRLPVPGSRLPTPGMGGDSLPPELLGEWRAERLNRQALEDIPTLNNEYGFSLDPTNPADVADVAQFERELEPEVLFGQPTYTEEQALERLRQRVAKRANVRVKGRPCVEYMCGRPTRYRGGAHACTSRPKYDDKDSHHTPSKAASPLHEDLGPAIQMDPADHHQTWTHSRSGPGYLGNIAQQKALIDGGDFMAAVMTDVADVQAKFPGKYDEAIAQMIKYAECLKRNGIVR